MIFQEPMTSLNPVLSIGRQLGETLRLHEGLDKDAAEARAVEMLNLVGIAEPRRRLKEYPHQLSGGMRQRVMIAMALACNPKLLIADEPTTALDVTIQAQILDLMRDLKHRVGAAIILITHDLGVVAEVAERVMVMYAGRKVEEAPVGDLFRIPRHPYTQGLLGAVPKLGSSVTGEERPACRNPGLVPSLKQRIDGCVFASRCPLATDLCREVAPRSNARRLATSRLSLRATAGGCGRHERAPRNQRSQEALPGGARLSQTLRMGLRGGRRLVRDRPRRDTRAGRRKRLRQVDRRARDPEAVRGDGRPSGARRTAHRRSLGRRAAADAAAHAGRVPGPVLEPQSAHAREGHRRRADPQFRPRVIVADLDARVAALMDKVRLPRDAAERWPHEFSGGQRQRIGIARALAADPT
jgi:oligopeptide/dipeptide ABC transporter ATP-binding protein